MNWVRPVSLLLATEATRDLLTRPITIEAPLGTARGREVSAEVVGKVRVFDLLVIVLRAFASEAVPHPLGSVDPGRDLAEVEQWVVVGREHPWAERPGVRLEEWEDDGSPEFERVWARLEQQGDWPLWEL